MIQPFQLVFLLTDVWCFDRVAFQHQFHSNQKPVKFLKHIKEIESW